MSLLRYSTTLVPLCAMPNCTAGQERINVGSVQAGGAGGRLERHPLQPTVHFHTDARSPPTLPQHPPIRFTLHNNSCHTHHWVAHFQPSPHLLAWGPDQTRTQLQPTLCVSTLMLVTPGTEKSKRGTR